MIVIMFTTKTLSVKKLAGFSPDVTGNYGTCMHSNGGKSYAWPISRAISALTSFVASNPQGKGFLSQTYRRIASGCSDLKLCSLPRSQTAFILLDHSTLIRCWSDIRQRRLFFGGNTISDKSANIHCTIECHYSSRMETQLRQRKFHLLSSTTAETFKHQGSKRFFLSNLWYQTRLHHYRFETTLGPFVMDSGEKFVFYLIFFIILLSVIMIVYYALSLLVSRTVPSTESTIRELLTNEIPKLRRVDAMPMSMASRKSYPAMDNASSIVTKWRNIRSEWQDAKSIED